MKLALNCIKLLSTRNCQAKQSALCRNSLPAKILFVISSSLQVCFAQKKNLLSTIFCWIGPGPNFKKLLSKMMSTSVLLPAKMPCHMYHLWLVSWSCFAKQKIVTQFFWAVNLKARLVLLSGSCRMTLLYLHQQLIDKLSNQSKPLV